VLSFFQFKQAFIRLLHVGLSLCRVGSRERDPLSSEKGELNVNDSHLFALVFTQKIIISGYTEYVFSLLNYKSWWFFIFLLQNLIYVGYTYLRLGVSIVIDELHDPLPIGKGK
jgi:thiosulfate reductase cytochrome b subunit